MQEVEVNTPMKANAWKAGTDQRGWLHIASLFLCCFGALAGQPSWGQAPMPPTVSAQEVAPASQAPASVEDTFYAALEDLSKKYRIAFVAEGTPFPTSKDSPKTLLKEGYIPEEETGPSPQREHSVVDEMVQQVAAGFDYYAVPQGKVYLLMKRYSNPEDLPDITPDECRNGLKLLTPLIPRWGDFRANSHGSFSFTPDGGLAHDLLKGSGLSLTEVQWARLREDGVPLSELESLNNGIWGGVWTTVGTYYFHTHYDWIQGTLHEMETRLPYDPYFHWKAIDNARVFGYDTLLVDFIPMSDAQRVFVPRYSDTLPRAGYTIRNDFILPVPDPTDPAELSDQAKQVLDSKGKSSHAISLAQAITALNRRAAKSESYSVDAMYAGKHVTLVGTEKVPPQTVMDSLGAVYGLHVGRSGSVTVLTAPTVILPTPWNRAELARAFIHVIPAPLYRAYHINVRHPQQTDMPPGSPETPAPAVTQDAYLARGVSMHSMVVRMFRYLAQQQFSPHSYAKIPLSRLGDRAHDLFELARMMRVYADICGLADCPILPPYFTGTGDFVKHVTLYGGYYGEENTGTQIILSFVYSNSDTGETVKVGPITFLDYRKAPVQPNGPIEKTTIRRGPQP
jgi:hypothetical protein